MENKRNSGVFWGAFDPPTKAHGAIINAALNNLSLNRLLVIVNNHSYKKYFYSLEDRIDRIKRWLNSENIQNVEVMFQDDAQKLDFKTLSKLSNDGLLAIAGSDAYQRWQDHSTAVDRARYQGIAVVPRGDEPIHLQDKNAFLLPIGDQYKYISSKKVKEGDLDYLL